MKKFLVYLVVILVAVSVGFTVFYLVKDNETISISASSIYMREGDVIDDLGIVYNNKKSFSDYEVFSSNDNIAKYDKDRKTLTAVSGGIATITFRTTNEKFRNLSCQVYVGNGTITSPYYIQNASELREIGMISGSSENPTIKYGLNKCYKLVNNINLADGYSETGYWIPIATGDGNGFTGNFDGNGYTISNININKQKFVEEINKIDGYVDVIPNSRNYYNAGLFSKIGANGRVVNLKIDNINISGDYATGESAGNAGAVSAENYGTIERVEVNNAYIDVTGCNNIGGITGKNSSMEATISITDEGTDNVRNEYVRYGARIDRCIANVNIGVNKESVEGEITGASGTVGGVTGYNNGGIVIYSYSKGKTYLNNQVSAYGGVVGYNTYIQYNTEDANYKNKYSGGNIKDCYSVMEMRRLTDLGTSSIGGVVGYNYDKSEIDGDSNISEGTDAGRVDKVIGNYYLTSALNTSVAGLEDTTYTGFGQYIYNGKKMAFADTDYVVSGKSDVEMKLEKTYLSYAKTERAKNVDTDEYETVTEIIPWDFQDKGLWYFGDGVNDGYPTLSMANLDIADNFPDNIVETLITKVSDLQNMAIDGNYVIANDIIFGDNDIWTPIGTENRPFVGSLKAAAYIKNGVKEYYKIYNLKTSASRDLTATKYTREYSGLFGVTSGEKGGYVKDITLVNPFIADGKVTGGIVAENGFNNVKGMTIENCHILGGTLRGEDTVGGIAGLNQGTVQNCSVSHYVDDSNATKKATITLFSYYESKVGGIVGYNTSTVSNSYIDGKVSVIAESGEGTVFNAIVGGIAGQNDGSITSCRVSNEEGMYINNLKGYVGGVAGINQGTINYVLVNETSINAPTTNQTVFAGGIVGEAISKSKITNVLVQASSVRGYNAGGLAGMISYSTPTGEKYNLSVDKNYNYKLQENTPDTFAVCAISDSVAIEGKNAGGFAAILNNGIIRNCYTRATLRGVDSGSIKAGFVVDLNLTPSTKEVGIIINCYNTCVYDKSNGKNYSVSPKEILQDPLFDLGMEQLKRNAGYCFDSAYAKRDGVTNPTNRDWLHNIFNGDPSAVSESSLYGTSPKTLTDRNFDQNYWKFNSEALPTLKSLDSLSSSLNNNFARQYVVNFPSENVTVLCNGVKITSGSKVTKGDILIISYIATEKYECSKFTVNGVNIENGAKYEVADQDVRIVYEQVLVYRDVNIKSSENGMTYPSKEYAKEGETIFLTFAPTTNYAVDTVTVKTVTGKNVTVVNNNYFVMPNEAVEVTVTFKITYAIHADDKVSLSKAGTDLRTYRVFAGDIITISVTPDAGYVVDTITVKDVDGVQIIVTDNKFTMPAKDVTIDVKYKRYGTVTIQQPTTTTISVNGTIVNANEKVLEGDVVTINVTPETGYVVDTITVKTTDNQTIVVTASTFVMPNKDVVIEVTFMQE